LPGKPVDESMPEPLRARRQTSRSTATLGLCAALVVASVGSPRADPSASSAPRFELPLDCSGTTCVVQNYFDHDAGPGWRDYHCGSLSYDGHTGTDIRVPSLVDMRRGVPVLAAAPGRVRAVRDGMPDVTVREVSPEVVKGRGAGNSVVVTHEGGWETQYSHLLKGSVTVGPGDTVVAGQRLGLIGLSGNTEFPHVELAVRQNGRPVDPFVGPGPANGCRVGDAPLWTAGALEALAYRASGVLAAGFAPGKPDEGAARDGRYAAADLPRDAGALVFWVEIFGARVGDEERLRLVGPDGKALAEKREALPGNKARWFSFAGKKRPAAGWPTGTYRGEYRLTRTQDGRPETVLEATREVVLR
jgi:hypothetical protein